MRKTPLILLASIWLVTTVRAVESDNGEDISYDELNNFIEEKEKQQKIQETEEKVVPVVLNSGDIYYSSQHDIERFNETLLLDHEDKTEKLGPLERMYLVRKSFYGFLSFPTFFPVTFNIYRRKHKLEGVTFGLRKHVLKVCPKADDQNCQIVERELHFDLAQLSFIKLFDDPNRRTIVLVPGWTSKNETEWVTEVRKAWLDLEDVNVIQVDWSKGSNDKYPSSATQTRIVSRQIVMFLYYAAQIANRDFESLSFRNNIYLIGHSLGAHIMGWAGHELRGQVGRITGLDPAGPIFETLPQYDRLNPTNAKLVDTIHTNGGHIASSRVIKTGSKSTYNKIKKYVTGGGSTATAALMADYVRDDAELYWGINSTVGHVDFFANGGSIQPGCEDEQRSCDHNLATFIYADSLRFELKARNSNTQKPQNWHHTYAFPANDYDDFQTGQYIARTCPQLISLQGDHKQRSELVRTCAVPMDFVTRPDELIEKLSKQYGIKFRKDLRKKAESERPYYFETAAAKGQQLVAEQMLLKIHLKHNKDTNETSLQYFRWQPDCHLKIGIRLQHNDDSVSMSYLDLTPKTFSLVAMNNFHGIVVPFANPANSSYFHPAHRSEWIAEAIGKQETDSIKTFNQAARHMMDADHSNSKSPLLASLPSRITVGLSPESAKDPNKCKMHISHLSVQPVVSSEPFVKGHYRQSVAPMIKLESSFNEEDHSIMLNLEDRQATVGLDSIVIRATEAT